MRARRRRRAIGEFAAEALRHGVLSSLSVPLAGSPRAAADLLARCLGPVLAGEDLEDELPAAAVDAALARRAGIRLAQDELTAQHQVSRQDALSMLMRRSQQEERSIQDVAEDVCGDIGTEAAS